jgi:glycosyltransferase involved in cell wall biosynthesis
MNCLLDLQALQSESRTRGIGRYSRGLAAALLRQAPDAFSVLLNLCEPGTFDEVQCWLSGRIPRNRVRAFHGLSRIRGMEEQNQARARACEALYDAFVAALGVDLIHIASPFDGFGDDVAMGWTERSRPGLVRTATVYDFIPLAMPEAYLPVPALRTWYHHRLSKLAQADLLLAISDYTRRVAIETLKITPERVINISADTEPVFRKLQLSGESKLLLLRRYGITQHFIMHTGVVEHRKNVETLIRAFALLPPEVRASHDLVMIGDPRQSAADEMRRVARTAGMDAARLVFAAFVPDEDLAALYNLARAAVMPSLMEGFGLPLLEAMRCGAPVLGADATSIPEVVGHSDFLFDPKRPQALAEKLLKLLSDPGFAAHARRHSEQRQKYFSWDISAARAADGFRDTLARAEGSHSGKHGRSRYVLLPPQGVSEASSASIKTVETALGPDSRIRIASASEPSPEAAHGETQGIAPEIIAIDRDRRVIILAGPAGLDSLQRAVLAKTPAVLWMPEKQVANLEPCLRYRIAGYPALRNHEPSNKAEEFPVGNLDACANLLGVLHGSKNLRSRIEAVYRNHPLACLPDLLAYARQLESNDLLPMATALADNQVPDVPARLLVDVSILVHMDAGTGIQRVVRSVLKSLLTEDHRFRIEPIHRDGNTYRYARRFTCRFMNLSPFDVEDAIVDFHPSDVFLGLDLDDLVTDGAVRLLQHHSRRGMRIVYVLYDLLAILRPDWFREQRQDEFIRWAGILASIADSVIAISKSSADHFLGYLNHLEPSRARPLNVSWWHLGCDISNCVPSVGEKPEETEWLAKMRGRTTFLVVGTIEPRKGIGQLLDAADNLWGDTDAVFALVGQDGWKVDSLLARIKAHPELGRRLFRFQTASDEVLEQLYSMASVLVLPSEGEGFGLPLIEAARRGVPIIARDLPVFREIAGMGAYYFKARTGEELAAALREWLRLQKSGRAPSSDGVECLTWSESTRRLLQAIDGNASYRAWPMTEGEDRR